jgi:ATP/maltotriose-dependent transcriptional regulator MalT
VLLERAAQSAHGRAGEQWVAAIAERWLATLGVLHGDGELTVSAGRRGLALQGLEEGLVDRIKGDLVSGRSMVEGPLAGLEALAEVVLLPQAAHVLGNHPGLLTFRAILRSCAGQLTTAMEDLTAAAHLAERTGRGEMTEFAHLTAAVCCYFLGRWGDATVHAERAVSIADIEDKRWARAVAYATASWVPIGRGQWERAGELLRTAEQEALAFPAGWLGAVFTAITRAILAQARGDAAGMFTALEYLPSIPHQGHVLLHKAFWQPLYVEALIGTGRLEVAGHALTQLRALAQDMPFLHTVTAWLAGQLAEAQGHAGRAVVRYEHGLALPAASGVVPPLHRARLEQAYGQILLARTGDRRSADGWTRRATDRLAALGARPFLDRFPSTAQVLDPRFLPLQEPSPALRDAGRFTDRERDIAHLVSRGLTNSEIAAKLFVSAKTVEYHLGRIYRRFGFSGRRELRDYVNLHGPRP